LKKAIKSIEISLPKLQLEIDGFETTRVELSKLIPELKKQCQVSAEDQEQRDELMAKVKSSKADMEVCSQQSSSLEGEVSKLQKKILDAGGAKLQKQKTACEKLVSKLKETQKNLNSASVDIKKCEKAEAKAVSAKEDLERQLDECTALLDEKEAEFKALEDGALAVMTAYEQVKVIEADKRVALENASKEAEGLKKAQSEAKCVEIELLGKLESVEKQLLEQKKKLSHWIKEMKSVQKSNEENEAIEEQPDEEPEENDSPPDDSENSDHMDVDVDPEKTAPETDSDDYPFALSPSALEKHDPNDLKEVIATLEAERNLLAKNANMGAIAEYRKKEADYLSR